MPFAVLGIIHLSLGDPAAALAGQLLAVVSPRNDGSSSSSGRSSSGRRSTEKEKKKEDDSSLYRFKNGKTLEGAVRSHTP